MPLVERFLAMASFKRKCVACAGMGEVYSEEQDRAVGCTDCAGTGYNTKPVHISGVQVRVDNRLGHEFVLTVYPDGLVELRQRGRRKKLSTSVQRVFNVARMDTARAEIFERKKLTAAKRRSRKKG